MVRIPWHPAEIFIMNLHDQYQCNSFVLAPWGPNQGQKSTQKRLLNFYIIAYSSDVLKYNEDIDCWTTLNMWGRTWLDWGWYKLSLSLPTSGANSMLRSGLEQAGKEMNDTTWQNHNRSPQTWLCPPVTMDHQLFSNCVCCSLDAERESEPRQQLVWKAIKGHQNMMSNWEELQSRLFGGL